MRITLIEALEYNMAPLVRLESTHQEALKYVSLDILKQHAYVMESYS